MVVLMFNFFQKSKKTIQAKKRVKKPAFGGKKPINSKKIGHLPPDQSMNLATEKLEATLRSLDANTTKQFRKPSKGRKKLIEQALAVHKDQSNLLNGLDNDTRKRLKTLAMELMIFKRDT